VKPREKKIAKVTYLRRIGEGRAAHLPHRYADELDYVNNGGILQTVLRDLAWNSSPARAAPPARRPTRN
jgi:aconitate hydratase